MGKDQSKDKKHTGLFVAKFSGQVVLAPEYEGIVPLDDLEEMVAKHFVEMLEQGEVEIKFVELTPKKLKKEFPDLQQTFPYSDGPDAGKYIEELVHMTPAQRQRQALIEQIKMLEQELAEIFPS